MYKNVKDIYFSHPVIANMVKKGLRKIPKNVNQVVTEISEPMKRIRELHPELEQEVNLSQAKKKAVKLLKNATFMTGGGLIGGALVKGTSNYSLLKDLLNKG